MDSRRFGRHYASRELTLARTTEVYSTYYDVRYPGEERLAARPLRLSPTYPRLAELGASFGEKSLWEQPNWFEPNAAAGDEALQAARLGRTHLVGRDRRRATAPAARRQRSSTKTSFAKIEVSGPGAADLLEHLAANRVARQVGRVTYTQLAERGRRGRVRPHRHARRPRIASCS